MQIALWYMKLAIQLLQSLALLISVTLENEQHLCWQLFFFPNSSLTNEAIPNRGVHLNKFYKPYQNSNVNSTCCQKNPMQITGNLHMQNI